jgi:catechol 2,3-dioxygenase-like lactoylglutathione lyase family enzyme
MERRGIDPIASVVRFNGLRRCAYRDDHLGAIVEVMEDGAALRNMTNRPAGPAVVYAAASVSDLAAAKHFYVDVLELPLVDGELHGADSDELWGLAGAETSSFTVSGGGVLLEIVQYQDPLGRPKPQDYRTSDQGIVNVAFGAKDKGPIERAFARLARAGYHPPHLVRMGDMLAGYILAPEREIELAVIPLELEEVLGFAPAMPFLGASE